jgi:putative hydrolase of HD superfamily
MVIPIAMEYERRDDVSLQQFFDASLPKLRHPEVKEWGEALHNERQEFQNREHKNTV